MPRVIFALLRLQKVLPHLEFTQTQLCKKIIEVKEFQTLEFVQSLICTLKMRANNKMGANIYLYTVNDRKPKYFLQSHIPK